MTIIDIARHAGVSKSTVSLVLNGSGSVKPATHRLVRQAMDDLGYVYNRAAANLRAPTSRVVGMVINDLGNPFFAELAVGIERVLRDAGVVPFMANTAESRARQAEVVRSMREHGASGLILCPAIGSDAAEIEEISALGMPLVLAIRRVEGARTSLVCSDNRRGAARVARHLLGLGHRRIAFLGGIAGMGVRRDRLTGFMETLAAAGVPSGPDLAIEAPPTREGGFAAMTALLARPNRPTAVACFNDVVAIGAALALARHGFEAGRDVAITGFDDTGEARLATPALTTVAVDAAGLGERAAGMLLGQMAGGGSLPETFIGDARLVVRDSCGAGRTTRRSA